MQFVWNVRKETLIKNFWEIYRNNHNIVAFFKFDPQIFLIKISQKIKFEDEITLVILTILSRWNISLIKSSRH